ncbi:hypothetical protein SAMN03159353_105211 [Cedecea sp. NFIX57]|nr:hypothetical protein SAMN03159353_105211 [Cedecea sp. NFIX57]
MKCAEKLGIEIGLFVALFTTYRESQPGAAALPLVEE